MKTDHKTLVDAQFGPRAKAYLESAVHARGEDLDALDALLAKAGARRALDLGCGAGHVAYLMERRAEAVVACDLSQDMLAAVAAAAREKGLANVETAIGRAEDLPFEDARFDFLACRYSAHHWSDFEGGLREARRVVEQGARAVFIDAYSPGAGLLDTHLQVLETLRDPSHVRNSSLGEWIAALARSGFRTTGVRTWRLPMEFASWTARMRTPELNKSMILALQAGAAEEARRYFEVKSDGSFMLDVAMIEAQAR